MIRADVLTLISEEQPKGVFEESRECRRTVFCNVRSVGMSEVYQARSEGLFPELIFDLSDVAEYHGEKACEWHGIRYKIIRTYAASQRMELTVERMVGYECSERPQNGT